MELTKQIDGKSRKNGKGVKFCQIWFKVGKQMKGLFLCLLVCLFFVLRGVLFWLFIVCSFASFNEAAEQSNKEHSLQSQAAWL